MNIELAKRREQEEVRRAKTLALEASFQALGKDALGRMGKLEICSLFAAKTADLRALSRWLREQPEDELSRLRHAKLATELQEIGAWIWREPQQEIDLER